LKNRISIGLTFWGPLVDQEVDNILQNIPAFGLL